LHEEFVASIKGIKSDNEFHKQQLNDQAIIINALNACEVMPENEIQFQQGINQLGYINPPRFFRRTIDEISAIGNFDIISNNDIREKLAAIIVEVEFRDGVTDAILRTVEHHRYIVEEYIQYDVNKPLIDSESTSLAVKYDIFELCQNSKIAGSVSAINLSTRERIMAYSEIFNNYQNFLPLIENELFNR
jgi:hypothetical protein